jgi:hypothetical protein
MATRSVSKIFEAFSAIRSRRASTLTARVSSIATLTSVVRRCCVCCASVDASPSLTVRCGPLGRRAATQPPLAGGMGMERMIVWLSGAGASDAGVRSGEASGAAAISFRRKATLPKVITSPGERRAVSMRAPLRKVPLLDLRSVTCTPFSSSPTSACFREIVGSNTGMSLLSARPTMSGGPPRSSNVCSPSVLISL